MTYADGQNVEFGDVVTIGWTAQDIGVVLCSMDDGVHTDENPEEAWAYLGAGVMIRFRDMGLAHFPEPADNLTLVSRAKGSPFPTAPAPNP